MVEPRRRRLGKLLFNQSGGDACEGAAVEGIGKGGKSTEEAIEKKRRQPGSTTPLGKKQILSRIDQGNWRERETKGGLYGGGHIREGICNIYQNR